jgi:hypothetical protein
MGTDSDNRFEEGMTPPDLCAFRGARITRLEDQMGELASTMRELAENQRAVSTTLKNLLWFLGLSQSMWGGIVLYIVTHHG